MMRMEPRRSALLSAAVLVSAVLGGVQAGAGSPAPMSRADVFRVADARVDASREMGRSGRVVRYVSLGDSVSSVSPSLVDAVAKQAGVSLHAKVTVTRIVEEDTVATLVSRIKS